MPPSGRYMPSSSERYDIYLRGPVRPPFLFSGVPGQMRWASASGRCRTDSPIAGRVGEKHFFSRIGAIRFGTSRAFPARTRVTFPSPEKSPKGRTREGPFRWGPSLMNPTPATTQRGAHAPLWIPPHRIRIAAPQDGCVWWSSNDLRSRGIFFKTDQITGSTFQNSTHPQKQVSIISADFILIVVINRLIMCFCQLRQHIS